MTIKPQHKFSKKIIIMLLVFSCVATYFAYNVTVAYGFEQAPTTSSGNALIHDVPTLGATFAPLVSISSSPFIALTVLSSVGNFLNLGIFNEESIHFAGTLMALPISNIGVFIILLLITGVKFLLSLLNVSKIFCDITLGRLENIVGMLCAVGGAFLLTSATTVYVVDIATSTTGSVGIGSYILINVVAFLGAIVVYAIYYVMRTMVFAIDILAFLFSPIPGSTGLFTVIKHTFIGVYTWVAISNPIVATIVGVILIAIACLVFKKAKRLELYYRRVYLIPFANSLFRSGHRIFVDSQKVAPWRCCII